MKLKLSLKKTWYTVILIVAVLPALLMTIWGGALYHQLLLEKQLLEQELLEELAVNHVSQEVVRLITLLENKSDPIAYTLARKKDAVLLDQLVHKVIYREPAIHMLAIFGTDGQLITGLERYTDTLSEDDKHSMLMSHWQQTEHGLPDEVNQGLQGKSYISGVGLHSEGAFFKLAVPVGPDQNPLAVLVAHVDTATHWQHIQTQLKNENVNSYLVGKDGVLLSQLKDTQYEMGDSIKHFPAVRAFLDGQKWQRDQAYMGLFGHQVFGNYSQVGNLGLGLITEINSEHILQPIRMQLFKLVMAAFFAITVLFWLGMRMVRFVIKPIDAISADFDRVGRQNYAHSSESSSFDELQTLINSFNHMVSEIDDNHQALQQASIVFENTSDGIIIVDDAHQIIRVNHAFSEITGYDEEDVVGKNPSIMKSGRHDDEFYLNMWQSIRNTGKWHGEIWNQRKNGEIYPELLSINTFKDKNDGLSYHIGIFTDISNIKETERKLEHQAHHDQLTGLPNRLLCHARMEHDMQFAKRNKEQLAIFFLDLDLFKNVNDSLGHAKGDDLLQQVGKRISDGLRDTDTVSRLGGDEFVIIAGSLKSKQDAALIAENILVTFSNPFLIDDQEIFIGASIGISIYPDDGESNDVLLRNADAAMYHAKSNGRNNYCFYTPALTAKVSERLMIETHLRSALEKDEFDVYYQPQYSIRDNGIIGVEALLRWNHPEMGMVGPDKFIPIAEEIGLIVSIGEWVLKTACRQLKQWMDAGYPAMRMAVNLSARQFEKPGLDKVVVNILEELDMNPVYLELELTESIIMHDTAIVLDTLKSFHKIGIRLSIDDFGTGYSSLSYIQRFPLDRLKIDRSFVKDIIDNTDDAEMIVSIIALAHSLNLQVIAEGVETKEQLQYLQEQGCDELQGYYFSPPVPAGELEALLNCSKNNIVSLHLKTIV